MCRGGQRPTRGSALRSEGCASRKHRLRPWGHEAASLCIPTRHQLVSSTEPTTEQKGFVQRPPRTRASYKCDPPHVNLQNNSGRLPTQRATPENQLLYRDTNAQASGTSDRKENSTSHFL